MEVWLYIPGLKEAYSVSNQGRVRSESRLVKGSRGVTYMLKGRILKPRLHAYGYPMVTMSVDGQRFDRTIHSLVAEAFIGPRPEGLVVCHSDGKPWNNHDWNLRYGTEASNVADAMLHGTKPLGDEHGEAVLSGAEVEALRDARAAGSTLKDLAEQYQVAEPTVWKITTGQTRKHDLGPITATTRTFRILGANDRGDLAAAFVAGKGKKTLAREYNISLTQVRSILREAA